MLTDDADETMPVTAMPSSHRLCVAPMMAWTDRHERYFLRLIARHVRLYTEMIPVGAILHGDAGRFLRFDPAEHPVALQLGGADPDDLARCAETGQHMGYDEINLNVGCPSGRVQNARFGACLMAEPDLVARCVAAMAAAVDVPVTVKTRIGIDDQDSYDFLARLVEAIAGAGCTTLILHARKALLGGLNPKQNREIPPLRYDVVARVKQDFPGLQVVANGGVRTLEQARARLAEADGVMIGREAYQNPYCLAAWQQELLGTTDALPGREEVVADLLPYVERELTEGTPLKAITRHLMGLFNGLPGARAWRRHLSEAAHRSGAGPEVIRQALAPLSFASARAAPRAPRRPAPSSLARSA
jgi:tRNA-dihydrouridine synthase A